MKRTCLLLILLVAGSMSGCAKHYNPAKYEKNFTVNTHTEFPRFSRFGILKKRKLAFGVNDLDGNCEIKYSGFVSLKEGVTEIGLAQEQRTKIVVEIGLYFLGGNYASFPRSFFITPKSGARYQLDVNYVDKLFDLQLFEVTASGRKPLDLQLVSSCK